MGPLLLPWPVLPSGKSSPQRRADTCCLTCFRALFLMTTSSSAGWSCGGTGPGCASRAGGPPKLHLVTPGVASRPSASSSLVKPTVRSSSVSDGCRIFHRDTFRSEHSHTVFSNLLSGFTENTACWSFRQAFIFTMEKLLVVQLSIQTRSALTMLQCINQYVGR